MSQLMSSFQLTTYPIVALLLFLPAFAAVCVMIFRRSAKREFQHAAALALDEGATATATATATTTASVARAMTDSAGAVSTPTKKACSGGCGNCRNGRSAVGATAQGQHHDHDHDHDHHHDHGNSGHDHAGSLSASNTQPPAKAAHRCCSSH